MFPGLAGDVADTRACGMRRRWSVAVLLACVAAARMHGRARLQSGRTRPASPAFKELAGWKARYAAGRVG